MSEPVYEQRDQWTVNACQTWTAFLGENCRKEEDCGRSDFFLFWHDSLLFSSQVQSFFLPFFIDFLFSAVASVWPVMLSFFSTPLFFPHDFATKTKNTRGVNTYNFNRLKEEDTFHIWCCFPHPWWVDRGQGVLPIETFLLPFIPAELEGKNESVIINVGSSCQRQSVPNLGTLKP